MLLLFFFNFLTNMIKNYKWIIKIFQNYLQKKLFDIIIVIIIIDVFVGLYQAHKKRIKMR